MRIEDNFGHGISDSWRIGEIGRGVVTHLPGALTLSIPPTPGNIYSDAQITDYTGRSNFCWTPPVHMSVTARASLPADALRGTAGFGFWNQPFMPGERGFRLPQAVWFFFSSPPSNMQLAQGVPGPGWKAATFDARRRQFFALLPAAPIGFLLMRVPAFYRRLWPIGQRAIGVSERLLDGALLDEMHTYTIDWQTEGVTFAVDDTVVHETDLAPRGPLGFIAWIDNQYAIATPQGRFGFGRVAVEQEQSLVLERIIMKN